MLSQAIKLVEKGMVPDRLIRFGIRQLIRKRLEEEQSGDVEYVQSSFNEWISALKNSPIALNPDIANEQHYEVPAAFFELVLGRNLKYSCSYFPDSVRNLDEAEDVTLEMTCRRAEIEDGMSILELGCGWGSLTLWMATHYPESTITAVSNSEYQKDFILDRAHQKGLKNIEVITCDMNDFNSDSRYDRVVSVEMLEHMRNYELLFEKIASWLTPHGKFFTHVFSHRHLSYPYETKGEDNWMAQHFFTGGQMPSHFLFLYFQKDILLDKHWVLNGKHYFKTAEAWLTNMDKQKQQILEVFKETYRDQAKLWFQRWRMFFMACAELWGYANGQEWVVSHFLFSKR